MNNCYQVRTAQLGRKAHPDVLANEVAQRIVYSFLKQDNHSKADVNVTIGNRYVMVTGQVKSSAELENGFLREVVVNAFRNVGYGERSIYDITDTSKRTILFDLDTQSPNISHAVVNGSAGDTITKHGYAVRENSLYLPTETLIVADIVRRLDAEYFKQAINGLGNDGKCNLDLVFENGKPLYASSIVIGAHHEEGIDLNNYRRRIRDVVIKPALGEFYDPNRTRVVINGTGSFIYAGPIVDRGVKGKKDHDAMYGDRSRQTGGSAYGKDASKVDFHDAVMSRHIAKNLVANEIVPEIEVKLGHTIGKEEPRVLSFDTFGSEVSHSKLERVVRTNFPLTPKEIIAELNLTDPWYHKHLVQDNFFGNQKFPWEIVRELQ